MTTITVNSPATVVAPRGAAWAAAAFAHVLAWMEAVTERRAERSEVKARLAEAAKVRSLAQAMMAQDPRFAADLFAAADRHERS
jgi:cytidylate kinase